MSIFLKSKQNTQQIPMLPGKLSHKSQPMLDPLLDLTSKQPYYVDRRFRPSFPRSPHCLQQKQQKCAGRGAAGRRTHQPTAGVGADAGEEGKGGCGKLRVEWDAQRTRSFKEGLRKLLKEYYEARWEELVCKVEKVRVERRERVLRVENSIREMLRANRQYCWKARGKKSATAGIDKSKLANSGDESKQGNQKQQARIQAQETLRSRERQIEQFMAKMSRTLPANLNPSSLTDQELNSILEPLLNSQQLQQTYLNKFQKTGRLSHCLSGVSSQLYEENLLLVKKLTDQFSKRSSGSVGNRGEGQEDAFGNFIKKISEVDAVGVEPFQVEKSSDVSLGQSSLEVDISDEESQEEESEGERQFREKLEEIRQQKKARPIGGDRLYNIIKEVIEIKRNDRRFALILSQAEQENIRKDAVDFVTKQKINKNDKKQKKKSLNNTNMSNFTTTLNKITAKNNMKTVQNNKNKTRQGKLPSNKQNQNQNKFNSTLRSTGSPNRMPNYMQKLHTNTTKRMSIRSNSTYRSKQSNTNTNSNTNKQNPNSAVKRVRRRLPNNSRFYAQLLSSELSPNNNSSLAGQQPQRRYSRFGKNQQIKRNRRRFRHASREGSHDQSNRRSSGSHSERIQQQSLQSSEIDDLMTSRRGKLTKYQQLRLMYNLRSIKQTLVDNFRGNEAKNTNNVGNNDKQNEDEFFEYDKMQKRKMSSINAYRRQRQSGLVRNKRLSFSVRKNNYQYIDMMQQYDQSTNPSAHPTNPHNNNSTNPIQLASICEQQPQQCLPQLPSLPSLPQFSLQHTKSSITLYLRRHMAQNPKAKQLYNFHIFMQQARKTALKQREAALQLDLILLQKQEEEMKAVMAGVEPEGELYEGCVIGGGWRRDAGVEMEWTGGIDTRMLDLLYWGGAKELGVEVLGQGSCKGIIELPV